MVDAGQAFLGGLQLRQQRRVDRFNMEQTFIQQNTGIADALITSAAELAKNAAAVGKQADVSAFRERLEGLVQSAAAARQRNFNSDPELLRRSVEAALARFDAAIAAASSAPSASEQAEIAGRASVAGALAISKGLTEAGTDVTPEEAAIAGGLIPAPAEPTGSDIVTFRMPDGSIQSANVNETAKIQGLIGQGGVKISLSVQSPSLEGVGAVTGVTKKEREALKGSVQDTNAQIEELNETLRQFEETPEAGGLLGPIIEKAGGLIQQLPGGERVLETAGVDPAEVKAVRGNARAVASRMLSTITGEESGRFTDREREIAEEVLGALDVTASEQQISAALNQAIDLMRRAEGRQMVRFLQASGADIATPEGEVTFVEALIANGFTEERAIDAMLDLKARLNID